MKFRFKSRFQQGMVLITFFAFVLIIAFALLSRFVIRQPFYSLFVTSLTIFYHFSMRLIVGYLIDSIFHNKINYKKSWFNQRNFEKKAYNVLRVKLWKDKMPTYSPDTFNAKKHSLDEIVGAMCQSEIVHEINVIISFVPLLFSMAFGSFMAFLITSIIAAIFDLCFVIMQRFNRPRLVRILEKAKNKSGEGI